MIRIGLVGLILVITGSFSTAWAQDLAAAQSAAPIVAAIATKTATPAQTWPLVRLGGWEHRPENTQANRTVVERANPAYRQWFIDTIGGGNPGLGWYYDRIDGRNLDGAPITGTTAEIILQAARKWGVPDALALAQAFKESSWRTSACGDEGTGQLRPWGDYRRVDGCQSFGLLNQNRNWMPDSWPKNVQSSGYGADYGMAYDAALFAGLHWTVSYAKGNWGRVLEVYISGVGNDKRGRAYRQAIEKYESSKPWRVLER